MHKAQDSDSLTAADPLLDLDIPWADRGREQEAGSNRSGGRWQPRQTILVSLGVSLALWAAIAALLF